MFKKINHKVNFGFEFLLQSVKYFVHVKKIDYKRNLIF